MNRKEQLSVILSFGLVVGLLLPEPLLAQSALTIGDNDERLPYHLDSLLALALLGFAGLIAFTMNHQSPKVRVWGMVFAAIACFCVAGGILVLDMAGQFAELRPSRFSIDPHKPIIMRILAIVFCVAGLCLLLVARAQSRRRDQLDLSNRNEKLRYGRVSRLYHWTIAILILLLVPMGIFTTMIPYKVEYRQIFYVVHKSLGLTVLLLAFGRIIWLMLSPAPKLSPSLKVWEKFAAHSAHYALYFFLFAFPITGYVLGTSLGKLSHFYVWDLPLLWGPDEGSLAFARLAHKIVLPFAFYLVFIGHVLGALKHQYVDKEEGSFRRMVT